MSALPRMDMRWPGSNRPPLLSMNSTCASCSSGSTVASSSGVNAVATKAISGCGDPGLRMAWATIRRGAAAALSASSAIAAWPGSSIARRSSARSIGCAFRPGPESAQMTWPSSPTSPTS